MAHQELKGKVTALIAEDQLEKAVKMLASYYEGREPFSAVALIAGQLEALNRGLANGLIEFPNYYQGRNKLRATILQLLPEDGPANKPDIVSKYRASLGRAAVLLTLLKEPEGLTITTIYKASGIKGRKHVAKALQELAENDLVEKVKTGKITIWKLVEKGRKLAEEFEASLGPLLR